MTRLKEAAIIALLVTLDGAAVLSLMFAVGWAFLSYAEHHAKL